MPAPRPDAPAEDRPRRPRRRRPRALPVYVAAAVLFACTLGFMGIRMADGQDPALGTGHRAANATTVLPSSSRDGTATDRTSTGSSGDGAAASPSSSDEAARQTQTQPDDTSPAPVQTATS